MDWMGLDGLSYTAVTPRASLKSDANNHDNNDDGSYHFILLLRKHELGYG